MKGGLEQTNSDEFALRAREYGVHQFASGPGVLLASFDSDGADAGDGRPLIETIASDDAAAGFRHDAVKAGSENIIVNRPVAASGEGISGGKL